MYIRYRLWTRTWEGKWSWCPSQGTGRRRIRRCPWSLLTIIKRTEDLSLSSNIIDIMSTLAISEYLQSKLSVLSSLLQELISLTAPREMFGILTMILYRWLVKLDITPLDRYNARNCSLPNDDTAIVLKLCSTNIFAARCSVEWCEKVDSSMDQYDESEYEESLVISVIQEGKRGLLLSR